MTKNLARPNLPMLGPASMPLGDLTAALVARRHPRVLMVDDGDPNEARLHLALARARPRWVFAHVGDVDAALDELRSWPPDVVVTFAADGAELLRLLVQAFPNTVRVVCAERLDPDYPEVALSHLQLTKPVGVDQLLATLEHAVVLGRELELSGGVSHASH